jgi:hypothetical protein
MCNHLFNFIADLGKRFKNYKQANEQSERLTGSFSGNIGFL